MYHVLIETLSLELKLLVLYIMMFIADLLTGIYHSMGVKKLNFSFKKIFVSIIEAFIIGLGIIIGTTVIALCPHLIDDLGIIIPGIEEISTYTVFNVIALGIFYYAKSFISNLNSIFKSNKEK